MERTLSTLQQISDSMEELGNTIYREERVCKEELANRLTKGLTGDAAIKHYNEWMDAAGMKHLIVQEHGKDYQR